MRSNGVMKGSIGITGLELQAERDKQEEEGTEGTETRPPSGRTNA
jgi:hypothetical protein